MCDRKIKTFESLFLFFCYTFFCPECLSAEGLVDRRALFGEHLRTVIGDVQAIFQSNAELAINHDHGLVAETHSGLESGLVATHEVGPLVSVQSDAVAGAVW